MSASRTSIVTITMAMGCRHSLLLRPRVSELDAFKKQNGLGPQSDSFHGPIWSSGDGQLCKTSVKINVTQGILQPGGRYGRQLGVFWVFVSYSLKVIHTTVRDCFLVLNLPMESKDPHCRPSVPPTCFTNHPFSASFLNMNI